MRSITAKALVDLHPLYPPYLPLTVSTIFIHTAITGLVSLDVSNLHSFWIKNVYSLNLNILTYQQLIN